jgi:TOMM system kinase/cyclase fusion protein
MSSKSNDKSVDGQNVDSDVNSDPFAETIGPQSAGAGESADPRQAYGRYRVVRKVGQGGFGAVFLGHDDQLDRAVAIKVAARRRSSSEADEFLQEARRLAQLKHPAILTVYDVGVQDGDCYIIADFLEGQSLSSWLKSNQPTWQQTVQIVSTIADALAHAHAASTVHRDIKPENIILGSNLQPVLVDFGLALSESEDTEDWIGRIVGSPAYMSPEQCRGEAHTIDGRADIYGLGVVLYRMLCGRRPFRAKSVNALFRQIEEDLPQPPRQLVSEIPSRLESVCLKAMSKNIQDRFTTAADFAAALRETTSPFTGTAEFSTPSVPAAVPSVAAAVPSVAAAVPSVAAAVPVGPAMAEPDSVASVTPSEVRRAREAERRQLTFLHCTWEVLDDEDMPSELDPEDRHDVTTLVNEQFQSLTQRYDGTLLPAASGELMACFGYPIGYEDAAQRAVRTGLGLLQQLDQLNERMQKQHKAKLSLVTVVHSGLVVVSESDDPNANEAISIVGDARNVVTRLQNAVDSDAVIITDATHKLVRGVFECESAGTQKVRGASQPVGLFEVTGESAARTRVDAEDEASLTPLVGRDREVGLLQERWEEAREGIGQVVLLVGDAGLGKSRLMHTLSRHVSDDFAESSGAESLAPILQWRCSPYHKSSSLYPAIDYFERILQFDTEEDPAARLDRLVEYLEQFNIGDADEGAALIAAMLSIPGEDRFSPLELSPQRQMERTLEVLLDWLRDYAAQQPVLFIVEDLHWVDPSTQQFLTSVVDQCDNDNLLALLTFRPEFESPWGSAANITQVSLSRLRKKQIAEMMQLKTGIKDLPLHVVNQIVERTDGIPLFVEEFTRMVQEAGGFKVLDGEVSVSSSFSLAGIPSTLQDLLIARLDRLGSDREVAQLAATVGREFTWELIAAVWDDSEARLEEELDKLVAAELVFRRGRGTRANYSFKHALIQDAAYESLLRKKRQQFHQRIADVLHDAFPETAEQQPELLAHHFTEAGNVPQAIEYWQKAGQRSQQRSANLEAISQLGKGIELVRSLEESPERDQQELGLLVPLGVVWMATLGWGSEEVGETFQRARELCEKLGAADHQFNVMWGLWGWRLLRGEIDKCIEMAPETTQLAESLNQPAILMEAPWIPGCTQFYYGEFQSSLETLELGLSRYDEEVSKVTALATGQNCGVAYQCYLGLNLWYLGYPDRAHERAQQMLELAKRLKHPFSLGFALTHAGWLYALRREGEVAQELSEQGLKISVEQSFPVWKFLALAELAHALLIQGKAEEALEHAGQSVAGFEFMGSKLDVPHVYHVRAEIRWQLGRFDEALADVAYELNHCEQQNERFPIAELHRLRGEILLSQSADNGDEAEQCFLTAIEVARQQAARSWELRAATSLARLLRSNGRADEARSGLAGIYEWFTEGFNTPDLIDARALLDELS